MSLIAVNIALVPDEVTLEMIKMYHHFLDYNGDDQVPLSSGIPHVTLRMILIDPLHLSKLKTFIEQNQRVNLTMNKLFPIERKGLKNWWAKFEENEMLQKLHRETMFIDSENVNISQEHFDWEEDVDQRTLEYVRDFAMHSHHQFQAHVTLGRGEPKAKLDLPLTSFYRMGVFSIGQACICKKEIILE